jgi:hypothetical protein
MVTEKKKSWFRRHWIWTIVLVIAILAIIGSALNSNNDETSTKSSGSGLKLIPADSNSNTDTNSQTDTYSFNQRFIVGDFAYTFNGLETESQIGSDAFGTFYGEKASGIFLVFDITVENVGKESNYFTGDNIKVVDGQGRTYDIDTDAMIYLEDNKLVFEQMHPNLAKTGKIVFDVPKDMAGKIEVNDNAFYSTEKVYVSW